MVTTKERISKEENNDTRTKPNVAKEAITPYIAKNKIDTVKKQRNQKHLKEKKTNPSAINQTKVYTWINQDILKQLKQKTQ